MDGAITINYSRYFTCDMTHLNALWFMLDIHDMYASSLEPQTVCCKAIKPFDT